MGDAAISLTFHDHKHQPAKLLSYLQVPRCVDTLAMIEARYAQPILTILYPKTNSSLPSISPSTGVWVTWVRTVVYCDQAIREWSLLDCLHTCLRLTVDTEE